MTPRCRDGRAADRSRRLGVFSLHSIASVARIEHMFENAERRLERITACCAARDAALLDLALAVADGIEHGAFAAAGLRHGPAWLRAYTESSGDEARRIASLGRLLAMHRSTRGAVESGELSVGRAQVLANAVTDARRAAYRDDEETLLAQAAAVHRVEDVEVLVAHWCTLVDQETAPGTDRPQRLYLQHRFDGGASLRGELDARTTEVVRAGLDTFDTGPDPVDGPLPARSLAERRADALGDLAGHAVEHAGCGLDDAAPEGRTDDDHGEASHDQRSAPDDTDQPAPARRSSRTTNLVIDLPSLAGRTRTDLDGIVATLDGRPLAAWASAELLCDTWIGALITDASGAVIDATETRADFTDTQRRLIAARDQSCVFPGCDAPPSWCDVHHLHWKSNGGGRPLDNGALLCRRHHTLIHRTHANNRRWSLHRSPDGSGWHATSPTGTTWVGRPRRAADEPPCAPSPPGREPPDHQDRSAA
jgi:hypothetical protein